MGASSNPSITPQYVNTINGSVAGTGELTAPAVQTVQTSATVSSTHQMVVAFGILFGVALILIVLAGQSKTTGNGIAAFLGLLLLVQGITHVSPFAAFITSHPLTPSN